MSCTGKVPRTGATVGRVREKERRNKGRREAGK